MARIPLPQDDELDGPTRSFLAGLPPLNIARMLARTGIAPAFYTAVSAICNDRWFPARDREIMLFRICKVNRSSYEIHQHRAYGGLPQGLADGILSDDLEGLDDWERKLCDLCDEITTDAKLSESSVHALVDRYGGHDEASKAVLVMAWFNMLSRFVDSTGVPIEEAPIHMPASPGLPPRSSESQAADDQCIGARIFAAQRQRSRRVKCGALQHPLRTFAFFGRALSDRGARRVISADPDGQCARSALKRSL
jgi:alkylhydroperoxidase family enzyme